MPLPSLRAFLALWIVFACLGNHLIAPLSASEALDSYGFESPYYAPTLSVVGQQGWLTAQDGPNLGTAVVKTGVGKSSSQGLQVDRAANTNSRWAVPLDDVPTSRYVLIDWEMRVMRAVQNSSYGPFFGVEAYDANGIFGVIGAFGADASTGDVLYQNQGTGEIVESEASIAFNSWHHYQMLLDFATDTYHMFLDGFYVASSGFVDGAFDELTDADIATFSAAGDGGSNNKIGTAYYDNFTIYDGVPGDFNTDLRVNATDLSLWQSTYPLNGRTGRNFLTWQRHYGLNLTLPPLAAMTLPEPSSFVSAALLLVISSLRHKPLFSRGI